MSLVNEMKIDLDRQTFFFKKFKHLVENNSLKNLTTYWAQQNWPIVLQNVLMSFIMNIKWIWFFLVIRKKNTPKHFKIIDRGVTIEESHIFLSYRNIIVNLIFSSY